MEPRLPETLLKRLSDGDRSVVEDIIARYPFLNDEVYTEEDNQGLAEYFKEKATALHREIASLNGTIEHFGQMLRDARERLAEWVKWREANWDSEARMTKCEKQLRDSNEGLKAEIESLQGTLSRVYMQLANRNQIGAERAESEEQLTMTVGRVVKALGLEQHGVTVENIILAVRNYEKPHVELAANRDSEPISELSWPWPITTPPEGSGGNEDLFFPNRYSGLWLCGYRVGRSSHMPDSERRRFLDHYFRNHLPSVVAEFHGDAYGPPGSEKRLQKMANVMAANCRNFKKNDPDRYGFAIQDYEQDHQDLRVGTMDSSELVDRITAGLSVDEALTAPAVWRTAAT